MGKNAKRKRRESLEKYFEENAPENIKHPPENLLSTKTINALRTRGLHLEDYPLLPPEHVACPSGYIIGLPKSADGNSMGFEYCYISDDVETEMPVMTIWKSGKKITLEVHETIPGPGMGDFIESYETEENAVEAILDYYFNPENKHFMDGLSAHSR